METYRFSYIKKIYKCCELIITQLNKQRNVFVALMKSMSQQQELYNKAMESGGALEEANAVKAESIDGKLNNEFLISKTTIPAHERLA